MKIKNIKLWARDLMILRFLNKSPATVLQMATYTDSPPRKISQRAKQYFANGLVHRNPKPCDCAQGRGEFVYWASKKGHAIVASDDEKYQLAHVRLWSISRMMHELHMNEFELWVHSGCNSSGNLTCQFTRRFGEFDRLSNAGLMPDGAITIEHSMLNKCLQHFVEIDLGTEDIRSEARSSIKTKVEKYSDYFDSGDSVTDSPGTKGFRVLFVTTTKSRAEKVTMLATDLSAGFFWSTTIADLMTSPITGRIWCRPGFTKLDALITQG